MSVADKFKLEDENYEFEGTITSSTQTQTGSTFNVTGKAGFYGKVWVTYNFLVNPKHETQGSFTGVGHSITDDGEAQGGHSERRVESGWPCYDGLFTR